jgi:hypothetical protein
MSTREPILRRPRPPAVVLAALGALAAHAAVYGTLMPAGGAHGYFAWYEPAVTGLGALAALVALALCLLAVSPRGRPAARWLARMISPAPPDCSVAERASALTAGSLAWLLAQESLERSVAAGRPAVAWLEPSALLVALVAAATVAVLVAAGERLTAAVAQRILAPRPRPRRVAARARRRVTAPVVSRLSPLATCRGLRAPPLVLG